MNGYQKILIVMGLSVFIALCMVPVQAASENAQDLVIFSDETVLGTVTSITQDKDAGALSVTITSLSRGISVQPAKTGDTLLESDVIMIVPGASARVRFADRPETTLAGGSGGTAYAIRRGAAAMTIKTPEVTTVVTTGTAPGQRTYTIPRGSDGQLKTVTITSTGGAEDYIMRGGAKIPIKTGMDIRGGDRIFIIGKYSVGLSEDKYLPPGTVWTITEMEKTPVTPAGDGADAGFAGTIYEWLKPFQGIFDDIEKGLGSFFTSPGSSEN